MLTLLIVDDDPQIRSALLRLLRGDYSLILCASAEAALSVLNGDSLSRPDVVLTDVDMPGGASGLELRQIILEHWPKLPVVVMTGGDVLRCDELATVLAKPFTKDELRTALDAATKLKS